MGKAKSNLWGSVLAGGEGERLKGFIREHLGTDMPKQFCTSSSVIRRWLRRRCDGLLWSFPTNASFWWGPDTNDSISSVPWVLKHRGRSCSNPGAVIPPQRFYYHSSTSYTETPRLRW